MPSSRSSIFVTVLLAAGSFAAHADIVNFDAQAAGHPSVFTGVPDSPLTIGIATFTGGQLLIHEQGGPADQTGIYATTNNAYPGVYKNPITISFSQAVSGFSLVVTDNFPDTYTVTDNLGDLVASTLAPDSFHTFTLPGSGITSVSIKASGGPFDVDFAIDDVTFTPIGTTVTPEPSSLLLLGTGLLMGTYKAARRRFNL